MICRMWPWVWASVVGLGWLAWPCWVLSQSASPEGRQTTTTAQMDKDGSLILVQHQLGATPSEPSVPMPHVPMVMESPESFSVPITPTVFADVCRWQMGWPTPEFYIPNWQSAARHVDSALIGNRMRLRWDLGYKMDRPDRAEFFTARNRTVFDGRGLARPETSVDAQELAVYLETALASRFSVFMEMPSRYLNPEQNDNAYGWGDLNFGFKVMFAVDETVWRTFQLRVHSPAGDHDRGMGTGHWTIEPGLLVFQKLTPFLNLEAELRDWIPIDGTVTAGNVLRFAFGLSHDLMHTSSGYLIRPVAEIIGWKVLRGEATASYPADPFGATFNTISESNRDTIINGAFGVRIGSEVADVYLGYSKALTGPAWFNNAMHVEFRINY